MHFLSFKVPDLPRFVVRATYPLPKGHRLAPTSPSPFTLYKGDDALPTQCDVVTRYANGDASVVELSAVMDRGDLVPAMGSALLEVREEESPAGSPQVGHKVSELIHGQYQIGIRATDYYGNVYYAEISRALGDFVQGAETVRFDCIGPVRVRAEFPTWLKPFAKTGNALPHFGGVQAFLEVRDGSDCVSLDVQVHNGGAVEGSENIGSTGSLYFKSLELIVPTTWSAAFEQPYPMVGEDPESPHPGLRSIWLVRPNEDDRMHVLPANRTLSWRMVLAPEDSLHEAEKLAENAGWGSIPTAWRESGRAGWGVESWTAPNLGHISGLKTKVENQKDKVWSRLAAGKNPSDLGGDDALGPYRPWGPGYGGVTGQLERDSILGLEELEAKSPDGPLWLRARLDCSLERQDDYAVFQPNGLPVDPGAYSDGNGRAPWRYFDRWQKQSWPYKNIDQDFPWRWATSPFRHDLPADARPTYEDRIQHDPLAWTGIMGIDSQHYNRLYAPAHALIYLDNDPLAKRAALMMATLRRFAYGVRPGGRLHSAAHPDTLHTGSGLLDRDGAMTLSGALVGWTVADDEWREKWLPWFREWVDACEKNISPCGIVSGSSSGKPSEAYGFDGNYIVARSNPISYLMIALRGLTTGPLEGSGDYAQRARSLVNRIGHDGLWTHAWAKDPDTGAKKWAPWEHVAIGPKGAGEAQMFQPGANPAVQYSYLDDGVLRNVSLESYCAPLGLAAWYEASLGMGAVNDAVKAMFGPDPLGSLVGSGTSAGHMRYALLGALQRDA